MAYTVNWLTKSIDIPVADLVDIGGGEYNLDLGLFHQEIRRLEYEFVGGLFADQILDYTKPKIISGTTFAPFIEIINGYTFVFPVVAAAVNLVAGNTNLGELGVTPANGVSIRPSNSAGNTITTVATGSGVTPQDKIDIANMNRDAILRTQTASGGGDNQTYLPNAN